MLEGFLEFYVHEFDETTQGIDLLGERSVFYRKEEYEVVDSPKLMKADL
mgnify:CR=1 FL=1